MLPLVPKHRVFAAYAAAAAAADTLVYNGGTTSLDAVSDPLSRILVLEISLFFVDDIGVSFFARAPGRVVTSSPADICGNSSRHITW